METFRGCNCACCGDSAQLTTGITHELRCIQGAEACKETLFAKVSRYKKLSRNDKDFITKYLKKMNSYGLVSIVRVDGSDIIIAAFLPYYVSLVAKALQNIDYDTLVEKLGVSKHAVKKWREGKHMPSEQLLKKIVEVL